MWGNGRFSPNPERKMAASLLLKHTHIDHCGPDARDGGVDYRCTCILFFVPLVYFYKIYTYIPRHFRKYFDVLKSRRREGGKPGDRTSRSRCVFARVSDLH